MKKLITLILIVLMAVPVRADFDYSQLDDLTLEELKELENEVSARIAKEEVKVIDGVWSIQYFNDEFGQPTDQTYITADFDGYFSDSIANKEKLMVRFLITPDYVGLQFYEYGNQLAKNIYGKTVSHTVRAIGDVTTEKQTFEFTTAGEGYRAKAVKDQEITKRHGTRGSTYTHTIEGSYEEFIEFMLTNNSAKLVGNGCRSETYNWEIPDMDNFSTLYEQLMADYEASTEAE